MIVNKKTLVVTVLTCIVIAFFIGMAAGYFKGSTFSGSCAENKAILGNQTTSSKLAASLGIHNLTTNGVFYTYEYCGAIIVQNEVAFNDFYEDLPLKISIWSPTRASSFLYELPSYLNKETSISNVSLLPNTAFDFPLLYSDNLTVERNDWIGNRVYEKPDPAVLYNSPNGINAFKKFGFCKTGQNCEIIYELLLNMASSQTGTQQYFVKLSVVNETHTEKEQIEISNKIEEFIDGLLN
ncbi:hypothetical protein C4564_01300 [Candidatus Microgenomates bacterium]|nr:MAG: hypothetical protein C4564_01300 [Candidatus Microgenomates bacterium]